VERWLPGGRLSSGSMNEGLLPVSNRALLRIALLVAVVLVAAAGFQAAGPQPDPRSLALLAILEGVIVVAWLANSITPHPVLPGLMAAAGLAALVLSNTPIAGFGIFMALITAGAGFPLLYGAAFAVLAVVAFETIGSRSRSLQLLSVAFETLLFAAAFLAAVGVRRIREEQARTRAALAGLEETRELQVRAARVAERVRLAREIHDVLSQTLSALALQLESARLQLLQRPDDPAALAAVERAHRLAREAMEEARRATGTLRGDRLPGPSLLADLASDFERDSGTEARLRVEGAPVGLAPEARLAIYRTALEALTNVTKHAQATQVDLSLRYSRDGAELTVENDGGSGGSSGAGGHGLTGIRERAELLGGRLNADPTEQGFRVRLWVPAGTQED
jgi:signal transduction histidine kinase